MPNFYFCSQWDLRVTWYIPMRPQRETSNCYFSCSGGASAASIKRVPRCYVELVFFHLVGFTGHVVHSDA
jgi:hypothetical protein